MKNVIKAVMALIFVVAVAACATIHPNHNNPSTGQLYPDDEHATD